jgi:hypothetical protein
MNEIVSQIQSVDGQDLNAIATDDNAKDGVFRVRIVKDSPTGTRSDEVGNPLP